MLGPGIIHYIYRTGKLENLIFFTGIISRLDVHVGKNKSHKKQCGLIILMILNNLTKCGICREGLEKCTDMRKHINDEHRKNSQAHYSFCYWIINKKIHSIYRNKLVHNNFTRKKMYNRSHLNHKI